MARNRQSIDGFIPRRSHEDGARRRTIGEGRLAHDKLKRPDLGDSTITNQENLRRSNTGVVRSEIDESLRAIEQDQPKTPEKPPKRRFFGRKRRKPMSRRKRIIVWISTILVIILLAFVGIIAYKAIISSNNLFSGNVLGLFKGDPLKEDRNGRSNVLVLGTTDDDPNHPGNDLTDTMMVLSVDQTNKNAYMFSIPRDLYVDYGMACPAGYMGKINAYFSCVNDGSTDQLEQARLRQAQKFIGNIFGIDIQYGVHVNSVVVRDLVDAVDGIDVEIKGSNGDPGILDRNFDWACNYTCYKVKYDNGIHHLDGEDAMYLAMARGNTAPTYGLSNSNFDREQNQQKIIKALQKKSLSAGTFTSFNKVTGIIDSLGNNLRTNFSTSEVRTLVSLASDIQPSAIKSINLQDEDNKLFNTTTLAGAGSVVVPTPGNFDYSQIQAFLMQKFSRDPIVREGANVAVYNGSDTVGVAQTVADKLTSKGMQVDIVANSPDGSHDRNVLYRVAGKGHSQTKQYLESRYSTSAQTEPPFVVPGNVDFVLIIGNNYTPAS